MQGWRVLSFVGYTEEAGSHGSGGRSDDAGIKILSYIFLSGLSLRAGQVKQMTRGEGNPREEADTQSYG